MLSCRQFYTQWGKRAFKGRIALAQSVTGLAALVSGVAVYFWQPEGIAISLVAPLVFVVVFLTMVAIGMLRAPFGIYLDEASEYEKEKERREGEVSTAQDSLEKQIREFQQELDSRDRMRQCAEELESLITQGKKLLHDFKSDLEIPGRDWRERVHAVLKKYWPTAASGFRIMHGRHPPGEWRKMLQEELNKLDGFMITLRNVV